MDCTNVVQHKCFYNYNHKLNLTRIRDGMILVLIITIRPHETYNKIVCTSLQVNFWMGQIESR